MKKFLQGSLFATALVLALAPLSVTLGPISVANAQITPIDEEPDDAPGLGSIVGSPEAGPKPEDPGDRGGYAQMGLAVVLLGGIGFIASRILRGATRSTSSRSRSRTGASESQPL